MLDIGVDLRDVQALVAKFVRAYQAADIDALARRVSRWPEAVPARRSAAGGAAGWRRYRCRWII
jgi:hypothetical protein